MDIYLIRHGAAVPTSREEISEDSFRYLNPEGRKKSLEVAKRLKDLDVHFDLILTSPLVRAVQTAEIFAAALQHKGEFKTAVELIGSTPFDRFLNLIKRNGHYKSIACFGHAPDVNQFAASLLSTTFSTEPSVRRTVGRVDRPVGKVNDVEELNINFKTCSVCRIKYDFENQTGKFVWFLKSDTMEIVKP